MKNFKTFIAVLAISLSTVFSASATEKISPEKTTKLRTEIASMIGDKVPGLYKESSSAEFSFIINNNNEIVIVSVDSNNSDFTTYIKEKLNYKKLSVKGIKKGELYTMPVKIKKK